MAGRLFLVNTQDEAEQAVEIFNSRSDKIIALSLEAEFYLKSKLSKWQNLLYKFLEISGPTCNYKFLIPHFKVAYEFCRDDNLAPLHDRFGYYFSELDRSLKFVKKVILALKPAKIVLGNLVEYPGASVIQGSLKNHAFYILSKEKKIPLQFFRQKPKGRPLRQILGKFLSRVNISYRHLSPGSFDLVILGPPRHIWQLEKVLKELIKSGISVYPLTYTLTFFNKKKLDKFDFEYFLKESLADGNIKSEAKKILNKVKLARLWKKFEHPSFTSPSEISFLREKIKKVIEGELLENIEDRLAAKKFFDLVKPKALLTTTDPDSKVMYFIKEAKRRKIKTFGLQHGVMWSPAPASVVPISEKFIAWSETSRKWVRKIKGFEKVRILAGQSPFHSVSKNVQQKTKKDPLKILYLATIVILDINMVAYWQKKLFEVLEAFGNCEIVVRIHPFQNTTNLNAIMNSLRVRATFDKNENLNDSIAESDLVIFEETTAGFDAMLAGKPTIFFNPFSQEDYFEAKYRDYAMTILTADDIEKKLLKYLNESSNWQYYTSRGKHFAQKYLGMGNTYSNKLVKTIVSQLKN